MCREAEKETFRRTENSGMLQGRQVETEKHRMTGDTKRQSIAADVTLKCLCTGAAVQVKSWHRHLRNLEDNHTLPYTFNPVQSVYAH